MGWREQDKEASEALGARLRCVPRILAVQNARLGGRLSPEDLADLTQDVFIILWRKLSEFTPDTSFKSWVYRICFLEMMNHLRKRRRQLRLIDEVARKKNEEAHEAESRPQVPHQERFERLYLGLGCLEAEEVEVIRLRHFEGRTFHEVAERLTVPLGTTKTRYYRGLTKLRDFLRNHEGEANLESARS